MHRFRSSYTPIKGLTADILVLLVYFTYLLLFISTLSRSLLQKSPTSGIRLLKDDLKTRSNRVWQHGLYSTNI